MNRRRVTKWFIAIFASMCGMKDGIAEIPKPPKRIKLSGSWSLLDDDWILISIKNHGEQPLLAKLLENISVSYSIALKGGGREASALGGLAGSTLNPPSQGWILLWQADRSRPSNAYVPKRIEGFNSEKIVPSESTLKIVFSVIEMPKLPLTDIFPDNWISIGLTLEFKG